MTSHIGKGPPWRYVPPNPAGGGLAGVVDDIFAPYLPRRRATRSIECGVGALGRDFEARVDYTYTPPCKGYTPPGDRQIDPDEPGACEIEAVYLLGVDGVPFPSPVEIAWTELDPDAIDALEAACVDDAQAAKEVGDEP